jgi:hypothetical protein
MMLGSVRRLTDDAFMEITEEFKEELFPSSFLTYFFFFLVTVISLMLNGRQLDD